jgi:hypothetical protein
MSTTQDYAIYRFSVYSNDSGSGFNFDVDTRNLPMSDETALAIIAGMRDAGWSVGMQFVLEKSDMAQADTFANVSVTPPIFLP